MIEPWRKNCRTKQLAVLGTGKLGGILLRAYLKQELFSPKRVTATVKHAEKATALAKELGISATTENRTAVNGADIVLLGVKPQVVGEVLKEIAPELSEKTLVIFRCPRRCRRVTSSSVSGEKFPWCARCPTRLRQWDAE